MPQNYQQNINIFKKTFPTIKSTTNVLILTQQIDISKDLRVREKIQDLL